MQSGPALNGTYLAERVFLAVERWRRASSRIFSSARRRFFWGEGVLLLEELVVEEGSNVEEEEHEMTIGAGRLNLGWFRWCSNGKLDLEAREEWNKEQE